MAEQRGPAGPQESWSYGDQPLNTEGQKEPDKGAGQVQAQQFVAASESFGPFGPTPDYAVGASTPAQPLSPAPSPAAQAPGAAPAIPGFPPQPGAILYPTPGTMPTSLALQSPAATAPHPAPGAAALPPQAVAQPYPYPPAGQAGPGFVLNYSYAPGIPVPVLPRKRRPIRFPLTRKAPALLQTFGMLLYGLVMIICIMGCALTLLRAYVNNASAYFYANGSLNGLSIFITGVLILVLAPACSLFCGALFGSWRGLLVSAFSVSGGLLISHLTDARILNADTSTQTYLLYASLPLTALVVGLVYDSRSYAAWWKSMLTMFLGVAIPVTAYAALTYSQAAPDASLSASLTHTSAQSYLATLAVILGIVSLILIPLLGLLYAGIEALLHTIVAKIFPAR